MRDPRSQGPGVGTRGVAPDLARAPELVMGRGCKLGHPMRLLATTTSTNDLASRAAKEGAPHGATWVAEQQTSGRGRRGRGWVCPAGEGLLFSLLLRVSCPPARLPPMSLLVGLAVRDAVSAAAPGAEVGVKWPNDVLVAGRKVAGVLVEAITLGSRVEAVVIGVGINVHTRAFPDAIAERATSVALLSSAGPPDRASILADVLESLDRDLHVVLARGLGLVRARLETADALRGRRVRSEAGDQGVACGIDEDGRLLVRRDDGILTRWSSGEVELAKA
jgi:BirA family transcriptional regulator, biotin operon repressor / biotin---[acetyl-CoA-carboxylase] ligase